MLTLKKYSSWYHLLRVVATIVKMFYSWAKLEKCGGRVREGYGGRRVVLSVLELQAAENAILVESQLVLKNTQLEKLVAYKNKFGVIVTSGRFGSGENFKFE